MKSILLIIFFVVCSARIAFAQNSLVFSRAGSVDGLEATSEIILKEAYRKIGIEFSLKTFPAERSLVNSNNGFVDGELNRIAGLEQEYPNLVMVPVPINEIEGVVFAKSNDISVHGWDDLKPYKIGFRIGIKFAEQGTLGMDVYPAPTYDLAFNMLDKGRVDLVVGVKQEGLLLIKKLKLKNIKIMEPPIIQEALYHYLNIKHINLLPEITRELQFMAKEGRIKEIRETELTKLFLGL